VAERHFSGGMVSFRGMTNFLMRWTLPNDLERLLQASIHRKARLEQLQAQRAEARPVRRRDSAGLWMPLGSNATVHGYAIGNFVYVGSGLNVFADWDAIEPALIDPKLPADPGHANNAGDGMPYWPSYSGISAASRTAYLRWLAGGRKDPQAYIGYVFLFFYGLERRVYEFIHDRGSSADEMLVIAQEIVRLRSLYARNSSFASYSSGLLDALACIEPRARPLARTPISPSYEAPAFLRIALGELAAAEKPIPATLALDWLRSTQFLNTPATRCAAELELLFHIRYAQKFGEGMTVKPNKTLITIDYQPASDALEPLRVTAPHLPDVTALSRPTTKLVELARECSDALDSYSRFLGKNPNGRGSLSAFALLPPELVEGTHSADASALADLVASRLDEHGRAHLGAGELLHYVRVARPEKVAKAEALLLAQSLEKLGYGLEPDVRLGGPVLEGEGHLVVFRRLADCPCAASDEYATATICMRLGALVSAADDDVSAAERGIIEAHIGEKLRLSAGERQRLGAHLAWLLEARPGTGGMKKRLAQLSRDARLHIGRFLVSIATTDGVLDPREMKVLEKLYALLGLDPNDLYREVNAASTDDEPVTVDVQTSAPKSYRVPPQPIAGLDRKRIELKMAETREVSALLGRIFVEEVAPPAVAPEGALGPLDAAHASLLRKLAARESWSRSEVEQLADELSLMTDGALEAINDYAYEIAGEPLWEDDDPISIHSKVAQELIA